MKVRGSWTAALGAVVAGCAAVPAQTLTPSGSQVLVSRNPPSAQGFEPRRCQSLGFVVGGNDVDPRWSSNEELVESAMIDVRNKAGRRGANYVQYGDPQFGVGTQFHGSTSTDSATISGTAYRCEGSPDSESLASGEPAAAPPTGAAGFTFGGTVEVMQAACETKYQWAPSGAGMFQCSGTPRGIGVPARTDLKFCDGSLCKAIFIVHPDSEQSSDWVHSFSLLRKTLVAKYGEPVEDKVVPDECASDVLPCVRSGKAHVKYVWKFPNKTVIALVLTNASGPDPVIRLTYALGAALGAPAEGPAL
jgi:hypothetical protein